MPDLNLDGKVNAADANALADNMGTVPGWTGTTTAAQFESVLHERQLGEGRPRRQRLRQSGRRRLAGRPLCALGVALPDRLAYTGTFEKFTSRWASTAAGRRSATAANQLPETGNYTQHNPGVAHPSPGRRRRRASTAAAR